MNFSSMPDFLSLARVQREKESCKAALREQPQRLRKICYGGEVKSIDVLHNVVQAHAGTQGQDDCTKQGNGFHFSLLF